MKRILEKYKASSVFFKILVFVMGLFYMPTLFTVASTFANVVGLVIVAIVLYTFSLLVKEFFSLILK